MRKRGGASISCKDAEQMIPVYLDGKLGFDETRKLMGHLSQCHDCQDELEIRFLIREGLRRVEIGETLDLKGELDRRIKNSGLMVAMFERIHTAGIIIEVTAVFVLISCVLIMFI